MKKSSKPSIGPIYILPLARYVCVCVCIHFHFESQMEMDLGNFMTLTFHLPPAPFNQLQ